MVDWDIYEDDDDDEAKAKAGGAGGDAERKKQEAAQRLFHVETKQRQRRVELYQAQQRALQSQARFCGGEVGAAATNPQWKVSHVASLGDVVVLAGGMELCMLRLNNPTATGSNTANSTDVSPLVVEASFSCLGGWQCRRHVLARQTVLALGYWDALLQLYNYRTSEGEGGVTPRNWSSCIPLWLCPLVALEKSGTRPDTPILSQLALVPLYFSHHR